MPGRFRLLRAIAPGPEALERGVEVDQPGAEQPGDILPDPHLQLGEARERRLGIAGAGALDRFQRLPQGQEPALEDIIQGSAIGRPPALQPSRGLGKLLRAIRRPGFDAGGHILPVLDRGLDIGHAVGTAHLRGHRSRKSDQALLRGRILQRQSAIGDRAGIAQALELCRAQGRALGQMHVEQPAQRHADPDRGQQKAPEDAHLERDIDRLTLLRGEGMQRQACRIGAGIRRPRQEEVESGALACSKRHRPCRLQADIGEIARGILERGAGGEDLTEIRAARELAKAETRQGAHPPRTERPDLERQRRRGRQIQDRLDGPLDSDLERRLAHLIARGLVERERHLVAARRRTAVLHTPDRLILMDRRIGDRRGLPEDRPVDRRAGDPGSGLDQNNVAGTKAERRRIGGKAQENAGIAAIREGEARLARQERRSRGHGRGREKNEESGCAELFRQEYQGSRQPP